MAVVVFTQVLGTRATRRQAETITELLLMVEQLSRRNQQMIARVGEQVGADIPKTPAEAEVVDP